MAIDELQPAKPEDLTLRDRLALNALNGLLGNSALADLWAWSCPLDSDEEWHAKVAKAAYRLADELLAARAPKTGKRGRR